MTGAAGFTIGHLAKTSGCKVQTIRYYEQIGLIPVPVRSSGNQRLYGPTHIDRLRFIRHSRELGFSLSAIRELLGLADDPEQPCATVDLIARAHRDDVDKRIAVLTALKGELERMIRECDGGKIAECRIIETLSDHSKRVSDGQAKVSPGTRNHRSAKCGLRRF